MPCVKAQKERKDRKRPSVELFDWLIERVCVCACSRETGETAHTLLVAKLRAAAKAVESAGEDVKHFVVATACTHNPALLLMCENEKTQLEGAWREVRNSIA